MFAAFTDLSRQCHDSVTTVSDKSDNLISSFVYKNFNGAIPSKTAKHYAV